MYGLVTIWTSMDDGPYWVILLMYESHDMRHTGFRWLTVVNRTPGFWCVTGLPFFAPNKGCRRWISPVWPTRGGLLKCISQGFDSCFEGRQCHYHRCHHRCYSQRRFRCRRYQHRRYHLLRSSEYCSTEHSPK